VLRWLLTIFTAIAVFGSSVTSWAGAGMSGDAACCCPVKAKCKCHDHDQQTSGAPVLKKCGTQGKLVAPMTVHATVAPVLDPWIEQPRVIVADLFRPPVPEDRSIEPETPPF
jgi:hypothetical protein